MSYLKRYRFCGKISRGKNISPGLFRAVQEEQCVISEISPTAQGPQAQAIVLVFLLFSA